MSDDGGQEEFERIRVAIDAAAQIVGDAMEKEGGHRWDYLVIAVPTNQQFTRIGMMSSVMPEELPYFLKFISLAFDASMKKGMVIDDRAPDEKPS